MTANGESIESGLDAIIVYDNLEAGKSAKQLCDRLAEIIGPGWRFNIGVWSFSVLQIPEVMQLAARQAACLPLIIVAADGRHDFPSAVKTWMGMVVAQKESGPSALVAQLHGIAQECKEEAPPYTHLKKIAQHAGMDFFPSIVRSIECDEYYTQESIQERAHKRTTILDAILERG